MNIEILFLGYFEYLTLVLYEVSTFHKIRINIRSDFRKKYSM